MYIYIYIYISALPSAFKIKRLFGNVVLVMLFVFFEYIYIYIYIHFATLPLVFKIKEPFGNVVYIFKKIRVGENVYENMYNIV